MKQHELVTKILHSIAANPESDNERVAAYNLALYQLDWLVSEAYEGRGYQDLKNIVGTVWSWGHRRGAAEPSNEQMLAEKVRTRHVRNMGRMNRGSDAWYHEQRNRMIAEAVGTSAGRSLFKTLQKADETFRAIIEDHFFDEDDGYAAAFYHEITEEQIGLI